MEIIKNKLTRTILELLVRNAITLKCMYRLVNHNFVCDYTKKAIYSGLCLFVLYPAKSNLNFLHHTYSEFSQYEHNEDRHHLIGSNDIPSYYNNTSNPNCLECSPTFRRKKPQWVTAIVIWIGLTICDWTLNLFKVITYHFSFLFPLIAYLALILILWVLMWWYKRFDYRKAGHS